MNAKLIYCKWLWKDGRVSDESYVTRLPLTGALKQLHKYRDYVLQSNENISSFSVLTISDCGAIRTSLLIKLGSKLIETLEVGSKEST